MKKVIYILILLFLMSACKEQPPPAGVIATVNGEPIYLHSLETLLDSRSSAHGQSTLSAMEDMQKAYTQAFSVLLTHTLVRQELEQRGIKLDDSQQEELINDLNSEIGEGGLDGFLMEASIRKDDWQELMRDFVALETFRNQVLLPQIKINLDEIRSYYESKKADFKLPAYVRACFLNAATKNELEALCKGITDRKLPKAPLIQCTDLEPEFLPSPWREEQAQLKLNECAKFHKEDEMWQSILILARYPATSPNIAELYPLLEKTLLEQKQQLAFDKWLEEKIAASSIQVVPELNKALGQDIQESSENLLGVKK